MKETRPSTAVEIYKGGLGFGPLLLTCEHASNAMPFDWHWPHEDQWLTETHWAWDPGAAELTRALAQELEATAVLSLFSRLLIDPNRPLDSATLFRTRADGRPVVLNQQVQPDDREDRIEKLYRPYHQAVDELLTLQAPGFLLAIHSFTPEYEGKTRSLEMGVIHVNQPSLAETWCAVFCQAGWQAQIDAPYAGSGGYMYGPNLHAAKHGIPAIMLEFRQDLIHDRGKEIVSLLSGAMSERLLPPSDSRY